MIDEKALEAAARAVERHKIAPYGWSDEEFETWWSRDTRFTRKPNVIREAEIAILAYESAKQKGEAEGWRPIESAPKDGTEILLGYLDRSGKFAARSAKMIPDIHFGRSRTGRPMPAWACTMDTCLVDSRATHWRPLPEPPMLSAGGEGQ